MAVGSGGGTGGRTGAIRAGQAFVELATKDVGLKAGLDKARRMILGFAKVAAGIAILGLGAAVAAVGESFREVVKHFDELNKASDRTGASVEALSALEYAAKQSDASLEDVANGAKFLQRTLSAAAAGGKEAQDALAKLGLTADDLKGKSLEEQFDLIADGLASIPDPADRTAAALAVLGRGGLALVPMLKDGAEGLRALRKEAGDVGAIISKEQAQQATRIGDALSKGFTALKYAFLGLGAALLPFVDDIEAVVNGFVLLIKAAREYVPVGIAALRNWLEMGTAGSAFAAAIKFLGETFGTVWSGIKDAIAGGDIVLAFEIAGAGLKVAWAQMLLHLATGWNKFKESFVSGWHDAVTEVRKELARLSQDAFGNRQPTAVERSLRWMAQHLPGMPGAVAGMAGMGVVNAIEGATGGKTAEQIQAQADLEKAAIKAAFANNTLAEAAALAAAQLNLEAKTREGRIAANTAIFAKLMADIAGPGWRQAVAATLAPAAAKGTFSTYGNAAGIFGGGGGPLDAIKKNTGKAADELDDINKKLPAKFN